MDRMCGYGGMADALDLGSSGKPCRFKSCYPHHNMAEYHPVEEVRVVMRRFVPIAGAPDLGSSGKPCSQSEQRSVRARPSQAITSPVIHTMSQSALWAIFALINGGISPSQGGKIWKKKKNKQKKL